MWNVVFTNDFPFVLGTMLILLFALQTKKWISQISKAFIPVSLFVLVTEPSIPKDNFKHLQEYGIKFQNALR